MPVRIKKTRQNKILKYFILSCFRKAKPAATFAESTLGDYVRGDFVLEAPQPVAQQQLALFQALNLQLIDGSNRQERFDGGLEIVMLQPHPLDFRANRGLFGLATIIVHTPVAAAVILPAAPAIFARES